jgi:hypothetical protein
VGIHQKDINKKIYACKIQYYAIVGVRVIENGQPKGIKPNTRGHKLRSCVYWQQVLKKKCVKQMGC